MSQKWQITIAIINIIAVPLVAFLIRMAKGDVHGEHEKVISDAVQSLVRRFTYQEKET